MNFRTIVKKAIPTSIFQKIEPTGHLIESVVMNIRYGFPGRKLRVIGVTGTNGKTTTTFMIHRMLHESGVKVGMMSTVAYGVGEELTYPKAHMTTTKASVLQKRLRNFAKQGVEWVVVETSSHSLAQHRVWGVPYEIAVITNLTHDHLEYHGSFENYLEAKRQLFVFANKHGLKLGIANADDPNVKPFTDSIKNPVTYGITNGDIRAENIQMTDTGSSYTIKDGESTYSMKVNIAGEFNIRNSLAAVLVGRALKLTPDQIEKGIAALESVEGRMSRLDVGQPFKVLIDFASTPDGFEQFFKSVRPLVKGKLVAVFGSAGRRDESKRAQQGKIAATYADEVIITEEDDRDEDSDRILSQIAEGAQAAGKKEGETLFKVPNREEAIGFAMTRVNNSEDMVVLLGKGHEKTIERASGEYPWNEKEVAKAALEALLSQNR